jgi:predicted NAD/FAD-dependent oxidoreductase
VSNVLGMMIESTVALLLMLTIGYCMLLNRRLKLLKSDEQSLRATISELVTATEIAERAIGGLKVTVAECERGLGTRLTSAERVTGALDHGIAAGQELLDRIAQIAVAGGQPARAAMSQRQDPRQDPRQESRQDAQAVAIAAKAFSERLRSKVNGHAA